jgi:AraC family transcriptional regulator, regulatory protein of adaptative response / methylated-DNA-[protein]-cysteine methyltransferase
MAAPRRVAYRSGEPLTERSTTMTTMTMPAAPEQTTQLPDQRECWRAVLDRDRRFDDRFVYAVRTTGIFCRPSCPARRPKRSNVEFLTVERAAMMGYRPCLRCRPDSVAGSPADAAVRAAVAFVEHHLDETLTLERIGREVGLSPFHLQRSFRERIGLSPRKYQAARRLERFRREAREGRTVGRATFEAGFNSSRSLYEQAPAGLGMTPGRYRQGGAGLQIDYTIVDSDLGRLLVAATAAGVCAVSMGSDDEELRGRLLVEFPRAEVTRNDEALREWAAAVARQAAGEDPGMAVPADLRGTIFQMRVWQALQGIPRGETRTYAQVAAEIGSPSATRAVASACAANHAALVVPCHRVVRTDGGMGGYRWGVERKRRILDSEHEAGNS